MLAHGSSGAWFSGGLGGRRIVYQIATAADLVPSLDAVMERRCFARFPWKCSQCANDAGTVCCERRQDELRDDEDGSYREDDERARSTGRTRSL